MEEYMRRIVISCFVFLLLAACASTPIKYESNPNHSEAWNVTQAAGIWDLRDVPYKKYREAREEAIRRGQSPDQGPGIAGTATFAALNYMSPPTGFSSGGAGAMGALAWLAAPSDSYGASSKLLVWMPKDLALTPDEAAKEIAKTISEAMEQAMRETSLPKGYRYAGFETTDRMLIARIEGPECNREGKRCGFVISQPTWPIVNPAPDFIGGPGEVWAWRARSHGSRKGMSQGVIGVLQSKGNVSDGKDWGYVKKWYAQFPDLNFYTALSKQLPGWCYIYLAPQRWSAMVDDKWILLQYPIMIHKGRVLYFVEPTPKAGAG